jgi:hypothetical protein
MNKFWMAFARKKFMNKELPEYWWLAFEVVYHRFT